MGEQCTWTADGGGTEYSANVLFQNPTEEMKISGVPYDPEAWLMEYKEADFPGLFDLIENKSGTQQVMIADQSFYCLDAAKKFDGKTIVVSLKPVA